MSQHRVVTFGELLLRLDTRGTERFVQAESFRARYTGAEANVAVALAVMGIESYAISKVPAHEIGQACINALRRYGVRTEFIVRGGARVGLLYVEPGAGQRPAKVIYDRAGTAFSELNADEIDWPVVLSGKNWLHLSGTAPTVGARMLGILQDALHAAQQAGVPVSLDCNYRSTLWSAVDAGRALSALLPMVDLFIGSAYDAHQLFGIDGGEGLCAQRLRERFGCARVAFTRRESLSASVNRLSAYLDSDAQGYSTREQTVAVVERIGGGDAFTAGLIFGILQGWPLPRIGEFALAAYAVKHSISGDFNLVTADEVERLATGTNATRIQR